MKMPVNRVFGWQVFFSLKEMSITHFETVKSSDMFIVLIQVIPFGIFRILNDGEVKGFNSPLRKARTLATLVERLADTDIEVQ